jgi:hypothetical protein
MPEQVDVGVYERPAYGLRDRSEPMVFQKRVGNERTLIAKEMVLRWGMAAAVENGEDSAGRQRIRTATPEELVQRACNTAELLVAEFERRGWYLDLPPPSLKESE